MLELRVIKSPVGAGQIYEVPVDQSLVLGRADDCDIKLSSTGISKKHCMITPLSGSRLEIEDLGSSNGTYVNGLLIKRHIMQPGDTLSVHNFVLQLKHRVPVAEEIKKSTVDTSFRNVGEESIDTSGLRQETPITEKINIWLEGNVYPLADQLSSALDVRLLLGVFLIVWTVLIASLSLQPFKNLANETARSESIEVARLYARQIVRLNQQAIIEQRFNELSVSIDSRRGQTPGVLDAMVLNSENGTYLAPVEKLGQSISPDSPYGYYARIAASKDGEYVGYDETEGLAYVGVPIKVGTTEGNKTVATAVVVFSYIQGQLTFKQMLDQIVNSLLIGLVVAWVFIAFLYRWTDGSLMRAARSIEAALKSQYTTVSLPIRWPALSALLQETSYALTKAQEGEAGASGGGLDSGDWAVAAVNNTKGASAAFNPELTVIAWNSAMAAVIGIQESLAVGSDISQASRDMAFEAAIREMSAEANSMPWKNVERAIEFSGRDYVIHMVCGFGAYLVNIDLEAT
jgi:hypothetical protein